MQIGKTIIVFYVQHAFFVYILAVTARYNVKLPNFTFYRERKQPKMNFSFEIKLPISSLFFKRVTFFLEIVLQYCSCCSSPNLVPRVSLLSGNAVGFSLVTLYCRFKILMLFSQPVRGKSQINCDQFLHASMKLGPQMPLISPSDHFMISCGRSLWIHRTYLNNVPISALVSISVCQLVFVVVVVVVFASECFT